MNIIEKKWNWKIPLSERKVTDIIVYHHAAAIKYSAEQVHELHKKENGWSGIAYHFYIEKTGNIITGRPMSTVGSHCRGHNHNSIGICFEGDFNKEGMNSVQFKSVVNLTRMIKEKFPKIEMKLHKELVNTTCPGDNFPIENIRIALTMPQVKLGTKNDSVIYLQNLLNKKGYKLSTDGNFGPKTDIAIKDYQSKNELTVDGIVGYNTWVKLIRG